MKNKSQKYKQSDSFAGIFYAFLFLFFLVFVVGWIFVLVPSFKPSSSLASDEEQAKEMGDDEASLSHAHDGVLFEI